MTAIVLPDIDRSTLAELRDRMPSLRLAEIDVPSLEDAGRNAGRNADEAIDRLLGRSRSSIWPWVAAAVAFAVISGAAVALVTWFRRPTWPEPGPRAIADEPAVNPSGAVEEVEAMAFTTEDDAAAIEGGRA